MRHWVKRNIDNIYFCWPLLSVYNQHCFMRKDRRDHLCQCQHPQYNLPSLELLEPLLQPLNYRLPTMVTRPATLLGPSSANLTTGRFVTIYFVCLYHPSVQGWGAPQCCPAGWTPAPLAAGWWWLGFAGPSSPSSAPAGLCSPPPAECGLGVVQARGSLNNLV